jgi:putative membrane protein
MKENETRPGFDPRTITRPAPILMRYYVVIALLSIAAFPVILIRLYLRYRTLRFRFDDEGISLSWGVLFRTEINLTYRRIQDIHLTHNIIQRWMGLSTIEIQTASGSSSAAMTIEGVLEAEALRNFLYTKMRGARDDEAHGHTPTRPADEALGLLREIREEIAGVRRALQPAVKEGVDERTN